jgi:hypothetical protein
MFLHWFGKGITGSDLRASASVKNSCLYSESKILQLSFFTSYNRKINLIFSWLEINKSEELPC